MLIHALCAYYDILARAEKVLPEGYSNVKIHYLVSLTEDGHIDDIINFQRREVQKAAKGKVKEVFIPRDTVMPKRTEKPGIESNIIEHRALYIFGLNLDKGALTPDDRTNRARKAHEAFVNANLEFLEGADTPLIHAYRQFMLNWHPEEEIQNDRLIGLGKDYSRSNFAFCLSGYPDQLLHEEPVIKERWRDRCQKLAEEEKDAHISQCAVGGGEAPIARIHNKIKGVYEGLPTGNILVCFKNPSENSYGNTQSYNSNISETVMSKYTEALNYLLADPKHKIRLDDITVAFWAMDTGGDYEDLLMAMLCGPSDKMDAERTEDMLKKLMADSKRGMLTAGRLQSLDTIDPNVDFYMLGLKPNSSRLAVKFIYRKKYAQFLWNIVRFQEDMQISQKIRPVSIIQIKGELLSPKSKNEKVNPALLTKLFEAVLYGGKMPEALLSTIVRRVKTDTDSKVNSIRAGIIKACINRNYRKGELKVALDKENHTPAYLCGRLFAVLEMLQQDAASNALNRTIKDAYFASASSKPAIVFPKLLKLAQNHLNKAKYPVRYNKLIGEIIEPLEGGFPETLLLVDQGRFIVGYYQQYQSFFEKKEEENGDQE
ncbi:MAG: type I-C CRISPR-associated protein Cas8c/Csd1 [Lachnospiraceae bacterium]|nr:type I-C CRISPR-associated protein Cas8c/Csd1 [Lachnospiraceae bacterium]